MTRFLLLLLVPACHGTPMPSRRELASWCAVQSWRLASGTSEVIVKADARAEGITIQRKDSTLTCTAFVR